MAINLKKLCEDLLVIRKYLIKIGPSRRHGSILKKKLNEANVIVQQYNSYLDNITKIKSFDSNEDILIVKYCEDFNKLYKEISKMCESETSDCSKMDKFDMKVALNLLPVMIDEQENTEQLIDGIEFYSTGIDNESQMRLISFVLKTRLSKAAKLKLANKYNNISDLLDDMKKMLLPKKSASALQKQLLGSKQNDLSIDKFGKTLNEMFVDLTISQSEGNTEKYNVLKSVNEKQAIRQFSEGLRNRRIGTVISAQKFDNLKDAIQAAIDEDVSSPNSTNDLLTMRRENKKYLIHNFRQPQFQTIRRGTYNAGRGHGRGPGRWSQPNVTPAGIKQLPQQYNPRGMTSRNRPQYRGNTFHNKYRGHTSSFRGHIRVLDNDSHPQPSSSMQQNGYENEFFRP